MRLCCAECSLNQNCKNKFRISASVNTRVSPTDHHENAAFDFANMSGCTQLIKEPTHKFGTYLDLLITDVPGVVDPVVDPPFGNSDHSSISFSVKILHFLTRCI